MNHNFAEVMRSLLFEWINKLVNSFAMGGWDFFRFPEILIL